MNLPLVDERAASSEVKLLFAKYRKRFSRAELPGIVLSFATNPVLLEAMLQIAEGLLFGETQLSRRHKEMLATYISRQNTCAYCADSHGSFLLALGGSPEMLCALQTGELDPELFSAAERALLEFAEKVNANAPAVTRADVEAAIEAGWSEDHLSEAVHLAALFAAFNRIANGFGIPSPFPNGIAGSL
jgi:uncharacterized peroxidase-related enzyme